MILQGILKHRSGDLGLEWRASHLAEADVSSDQISVWHFAARFVANKIADDAAAAANAPEHIQDAYRLLRAMCTEGQAPTFRCALSVL